MDALERDQHPLVRARQGIGNGDCAILEQWTAEMGSSAALLLLLLWPLRCGRPTLDARGWYWCRVNPGSARPHW
jgi:hypothetical protein